MGEWGWGQGYGWVGRAIFSGQYVGYARGVSRLWSHDVMPTGVPGSPVLIKQ